MKTLIAVNVRAYSVVILFLMTLSACSIGNKFLSQNPAYHLNLVKAENAPAQAKMACDVNCSSPVKQLLQRASLSLNTTYEIPATFLHVQKVNEQKHKNASHIFFSSAGKKVKDKVLRSARAFPVRDRSPLLDRPIGIFLICLLCCLAALLCFVLAPQVPFLYLIGYLTAITAIIFFAVWIISVVDYYYD